jgi:hypothetical protein
MVAGRLVPDAAVGSMAKKRSARAIYEISADF